MENELLEKILAKIVNIEEYMKENMAIKDELRESEDRLITHIDGFVKLHETLDLELVALRGKYDRLEERVEMLEQKISSRS